MLTLFILTVLSCSIHSSWTATPFKDCGSELGVIVAFHVTDCDAVPCQLIKGHTYAMNLTFQAKAATKSATLLLHGIIGGVPIPFPVPQPDACKGGVKCPVAQGDTDIATLSLPVEQSYPSISLSVKLELKADDPGQDYVCLEFPAAISSGERNLVGWEKGKLFEKLN